MKVEMVRMRDENTAIREKYEEMVIEMKRLHDQNKLLHEKILEMQQEPPASQSTTVGITSDVGSTSPEINNTSIIVEPPIESDALMVEIIENEMSIVEETPPVPLPSTSCSSTKPDKPSFPCLLCEGTFTRNSSLKKHMSIYHSGNPKPTRNMYGGQVPCDICHKKFARKAELERHVQRVHLPPSQHACHCGKQFNVIYDFNDHKSRCIK